MDLCVVVCLGEFQSYCVDSTTSADHDQCLLTSSFTGAKHFKYVLAQQQQQYQTIKENFKGFAPARLLSERCTFYKKIAHPSVFLPSSAAMSINDKNMR